MAIGARNTEEKHVRDAWAHMTATAEELLRA